MIPKYSTILLCLLRCPIALLNKPSWYYKPSCHALCSAFLCLSPYLPPVSVSVYSNVLPNPGLWGSRLLPRPRHWPPAWCAPGPRRGPAVTAVSALWTRGAICITRGRRRSHGGENQRILCCKWCIVCRNNGQISMNNQRNGSYILFISYYLLQLFLDM